MPMAVVVGGLLPMPMTMLAMDESMAKDVVFVCRSRPDAWTVMASLQIVVSWCGWWVWVSKWFMEHNSGANLTSNYLTPN